MKDRLFEIWFALRCGIQNMEFQTLLERYGAPYELFNADEAELEKLPCSQAFKTRLADKSLNEAKWIMDYCRRNRVGILFWQDKEYPASLRALVDPPVLLYYVGQLPDFTRRLCISVVGTRSMSEYGKRMSYKIGYELASAKAVIISGMALGNDSVALAGALAAKGQTVAVLGCGIDTVYPREHEVLARRIRERGCVMTEYPPTTPPEGRNFPIRNRIISGLSQGTVVIEGDLHSGAMITARTAILQGRNVYAIPGNVGETNTAGTNSLINDGAVMIRCARDLIEDYLFLYREMLDLAWLTRAERYSDPDEKFLAELGISTRVDHPRSRKSKATAEINPGQSPGIGSDASASAKSPAPASRAASAASRESRAPKRPAASGAPQEPPASKRPAVSAAARGDSSERILSTLSDVQRRIFEILPLDHAVTVDYITREGFSTGEVMAAMTVLEIKGLTVTLPGGLYSRK